MKRRAPRQNNRLKKAATVMGAAAFVVFVILFVLDVFTARRAGTITDECEFQFIDVGQGDCTMVITGDNAVVIDAGPAAAAADTAKYIRSYTDEIDYLILTHPHEDHVGGASEIISDIKTDCIIMTNAFSDTYTFSKLLTTIENSGVSVTEASAGSTFSAGDINVRLLAPIQEFDDYNDYSIVAKVSYGNVSAIITGDAETTSEKAMLGFYTKEELSADIIKLGHHGSSTSSSTDFLKTVDPAFAVISCGYDNPYGHPHMSTVERLDSLDIPFFRTDRDGTVAFATDGRDVWKIDQ